MRAGESLFGNAILFVSLLATVGIGALAAVGLIIAAWRRRVRLPLDRSRLPRGWRVLRGGKRGQTGPRSPHRKAGDGA